MCSFISQFFSHLIFGPECQEPHLRRSTRLQEKGPQLLTARIRLKSNLQRLLEVSFRWNKRALYVQDDAYAIYQLIDTTIWNSRVYAAYDRQCKIQGIALASFSASGITQLKILATNPDNLALTSQRIKGVGSALLAHISSDMLSRKTKKLELHLDATEAAVGFYKHLGFVKSPFAKFEWILHKNKMKDLILKCAHVIKINNKEPDLTFYNF